MKTSREVLTLWDGEELTLLPHDIVAALPADDRRRYEEKLHGYDLDNDNRTDYYSRWVAYRDRCAHEGCTKVKYESYKHCITHVSVDDIEDPNRQVNRRATKAKLRMAELLEGAVDELEKIVMAPPEEMAPAVRLKAIDTLFDRAHLPRQTAQSVDHSGEIAVVHTDITAVIQGRLDRLAETLTSESISELEAGFALDAEVIEEAEDQ
jgi:hypothetical protein